jgi:hypothetical protein
VIRDNCESATRCERSDCAVKRIGELVELTVHFNSDRLEGALGGVPTSTTCRCGNRLFDDFSKCDGVRNRASLNDCPTDSTGMTLLAVGLNDPDQLRRCELFGADILETSVAMGGTVTGEHGVGVEKLNSMCVQFSAAENAQMFGVKRAFDPQGLLNPGKVIPTLQRCAEYGKELVRGGKLKHPDLPRF